ncbi:MAG: ribbon-helix-helix domain-containing protein [Actinobacteria bacterium]|nr:ribbon-helix-helix domain-containing protein [Actinomycetota bacterium]
MSEQIAVRIPDQLADSLEDLVSRGEFETKADAIRAALEALIEAERRRRVGELIADGYRRIPQDDDEVEAARLAAIRSIEEEPW